MPDPQPEDRRRLLEADLRPLDTDGDGVSDSDELAAGSDPDDASDVPFDLSLLPDSPANAPAPDAEPVIPNKEFWEQHYAREVQDDGSVVITPRKSFDAPDEYTGKVADMKRDTDRDGLTDWQEYERQTDPENPDTDGDGRSDGDELAQGFDPTSPTPPNATPDDQDGDGISDLDEIRFGGGGGFTIDKNAAAGLGTDGVQIKDQYFESHRTGDPVGDAVLRQILGQELTPGELDTLTTAIGDDLFSDSALSRARAESALAAANGIDVDPGILEAGAAEFAANAQTQLTSVLANLTGADVVGALRQDALLGGGLLTDTQRGQLLGAIDARLNPGGTTSTGSTTSQPGTGGAGIAPGVGDVSGSDGGGTGSTSGGGTSGRGTGVAPDADGYGSGRGPDTESHDNLGGAADTPGQPDPFSGTGTSSGSDAASVAPDAPGTASSPDRASSDPVGAGGSRTTEPSTSGLGIGPLNTTPGTAGESGASIPVPGSDHNDGVDNNVDFDATEIPAGNPLSWPAITGSPVAPSSPGASTSGDGTNPNEGTTDDDAMPADDGSDPVASDDSGDDGDGGDGDGDSGDDGDDSGEADGDGEGEGGDVADDDSSEAAAWIDADAAGGIGSAGADYGGVVRGDFLAGAGGSIVDIRFTNTGRPDVVVGGPDTSAPPIIPVRPGGETPQDDAADVFAFSEVDITRLPGVVTTVRPDLVERLPTLDPSTLDPDINPQAFSVGFVMDAQLSIDAAIISDAALVGLGAVDDASFGAASDFGSQLEVDEFGESGPIGFDGDGGDGMFGGPDGGPMP